MLPASWERLMCTLEVKHCCIVAEPSRYEPVICGNVNGGLRRWSCSAGCSGLLHR